MFRTSVSWLCAIIVFLLPSAASADIRLCLGENGHVAIEQSSQGDCASHEFSITTNRDAGPTTESSELQHSECGPCADVPLFQNELRDSATKPLLTNKTLFVSLSIFLPPVRPGFRLSAATPLPRYLIPPHRIPALAETSILII